MRVSKTKPSSSKWPSRLHGYLVKWDNSGVSVYFFPAGTTPADIEAGLPQPDNWGRPQARWPADQCDPWRFFTTHQMIFDTTFWCVFLFFQGTGGGEVLIPILVVIGRLVFGVRVGYPDKSRAVRSGLVSAHVRRL